MKYHIHIIYKNLCTAEMEFVHLNKEVCACLVSKHNAFITLKSIMILNIYFRLLILYFLLKNPFSQDVLLLRILTEKTHP